MSDLCETCGHHVHGVIRCRVGGCECIAFSDTTPAAVAHNGPISDMAVSGDGRLADWLRDWRRADCEHALPDDTECCSPCLRDRLLGSNWLAAHDAAVRAEHGERIERQTRNDWADYFEHWMSAVGPEPLTTETVIQLLRADHTPFGFAQTESEGER